MPFTCFFLSACHISDSLLIVSLWLSKVNHFLPFCQRKTIPVFRRIVFLFHSYYLTQTELKSNARETWCVILAEHLSQSEIELPSDIQDIASRTFDTPIRRIPSVRTSSVRDTFGKIQVSKPSFLASCTLCFAILTARTSPLSPTSPKQIVLSEIASSR